MPLTYINYGHTIDKLLPLSKSSSPFSFRIWINNSTSINRVISVSIDSNSLNQCTIIEIGDLYKNKKSKYFYSEKTIEPKSGFLGFKKIIDSLNLMEYKNQNPYDVIIVSHQAFSKYIVEINDHGKYNIFEFLTYYPLKSTTNTKYDFIEKLIKEEFEIKYRFK
ncbi:MAG: hypothetical protein KA319_08015 [Ferruginibacter sp.]|nr:hypothetical protein [Ferruginibacter sp.]